MVDICDQNPDKNEILEVDESFSVRLEPLRQYLKQQGIAVRGLPDVAAGFSDRVDDGDMYYLISEGDPNTDASTKSISCETWQLTLVIMHPHRYSKFGLYDCYNRARKLLVGFKPPYCKDGVGVPRWRFTRDESFWVIEANFPFDVYLNNGDLEDEINSILEMEITSGTRKEVITNENTMVD